MLRISSIIAAATATVALAGASAASAATYTFIPYNITSTTDATVTTNGNKNSTNAPETFNDSFAFAVSGDDLADFTYSVTYSTKNKDNLTSIDLGLYAGAPTSSGAAPAGAVEMTPSTIYPGGYPTYEYELSAGDYFIEATTVVPKGETGLYTVTASGSPISAAPEPGTWALMFAGVGIAGAALRMGRRTGKLAAA